MKQKNHNWIYYVLGIGILAGILYIATKDITPITRDVVKIAEIRYEK